MKAVIGNKGGGEYGSNSSDGGYILLGVFILLGLILAITASIVNNSSSAVRTRAVVQTQTQHYYQVEESLNAVVGWLQENSTAIADAFTAANFHAHFELGAPTNGDNEGLYFETPTMVKLRGTNNSALLSNNIFFGTSAFPELNDLSGGAAFDAVSSFENADLGEANARIVLIWARETDGNYEPIFRVDVVTGNNPDRGVHSYSYIYSTLVSGAGDVGFYGQNSLIFQTPNNDCYSYYYTNTGAGSWDRGAPRANCPIGSDAGISVSSDIHGTAKSLANLGVTLNPPGGAISGEVCEGPGCHSISLTSHPAYLDQCPSGGEHILVLNSRETRNLPNGGCYGFVYIANKSKVVLSDTTQPYIFSGVYFGPNSAQFAFADTPADKHIEVFIETFSNGHMNGNQFYAQNLAPHQVKLNYTGFAPIKFNGTAAFNAFVEAPYAHVDVNGNFIFYGGIKAKSLTISGKARVNFDETKSAAPTIADMQFALKKASQRYR